MSAIANIVLTDGKATPLSHTYLPLQAGPKSVWRENDASLPIVGQGVLSVDSARIREDAGVSIVDFVLTLPALETITAQNSGGYTAAPKVAYDLRVKCSFYLPNRSTVSQRKDLRALFRNFINDSQIISVIEDLVRPT